MKILVTGCAGFIGYHLSASLLHRGDEVVGIDNVNDYYDVRLKQARLEQLHGQGGFEFVKSDIADRSAVEGVFLKHDFDAVVNLAAQAGVRYSLVNPQAYIDSNLVGFGNILEACRRQQVPHLVYASSSSVYGANTSLPFSIHDNVDHPISLYAATKKSNELMAHAYSAMFGLPTTGLRFFNVYGPWGRPDSAIYLFTQAILNDRPIDVYNYGNMKRDFTYIDDIIEGTIRIIDKIPEPDPHWTGAEPDPGSSKAPYRVYNIGNNTPVELNYFIELIEKAIGKKAIRNPLPMQPGEVPATFADIDDLARDVGFRPKTSIEEGVARFVDWYRAYHSPA